MSLGDSEINLQFIQPDLILQLSITIKIKKKIKQKQWYISIILSL